VIKTKLKIVFSWNDGDLVLQARRPGDSNFCSSFRDPNSPAIFLDIWLINTPIGLTSALASSNSVQQGLRGRQDPPIGGSASTNLAFSLVLYFRSLVKTVPRSSSSTFVQVPLPQVSGLLSPLESPEYIIATHSSQTLEVSLPRLHLSFFVNANWELECRSMPGYVIDKTQSCGTMFGLRNKLILCPSSNNSEELLLPRRVIIPQGDYYLRDKGRLHQRFHKHRR
jgi:hypothetical protein